MDILKRSFDVVFALTLGALLLPVLAVIAIAIKVTSPGPLLFRQCRLGRGGETFMINKFRKFPPDWGTQGPGVTLQFDSRMTRVGRLLERTKLDELPQLWNILIGEMSFVGPRPESLRFKHLFQGDFAGVLDYTPGIFGPNQTKYRNESVMYPVDEDPDEFYERVLFPDKARRDLEYFKQSGFFRDIQCILSGVCALMFSVVIWRKSVKSALMLLSWDVLAVIVAWMTTHWMKYSLISAKLRVGLEAVYLWGFLIAPVSLIVVFGIARVYRHPVRYFSETDLYRLAGATCVAWTVAAITFGLTLTSISSLLLAVTCIVSIFLMALPRVAYSLYCESSIDDMRLKQTQKVTNILVCGIGIKTINLCNLLKAGYPHSRVIGILTDQEDHVSREIHGFEVLGMFKDLEVLNHRYAIDQVWVGSGLSARNQNLVDVWCSDNQVALVTLDELPGFNSFADTRKMQGRERAVPAVEPRKHTVAATKQPEVA